MSGKNCGIEREEALGYGDLVDHIGELLEAARRATTRSINAIMTATYWEVGRRIVEFEQRGAERAQYGKGLLNSLSAELTERFGRGFSRHNLARFRDFYLTFPPEKIRATLSLKSPEAPERDKRATASRESPDSLLQAPSAEESTTLLRISGARQDATGDGEMGCSVVDARLSVGSGSPNGGLGKARALFGPELKALMDELNGVLVS